MKNIGQEILDKIIEFGIVGADSEGLVVWDAGSADVLETIFIDIVRNRLKEHAKQVPGENNTLPIHIKYQPPVKINNNMHAFFGELLLTSYAAIDEEGYKDKRNIDCMKLAILDSIESQFKELSKLCE